MLKKYIFSLSSVVYDTLIKLTAGLSGETRMSYDTRVGPKLQDTIVNKIRKRRRYYHPIHHRHHQMDFEIYYRYFP